MHDFHHPNSGKDSYDPIARGNAQGLTFTKFWLKNGEKLTRIQRIGYGLLSILYLAIGILFAQLYWDVLHEHNLFWSLVRGSLSLCFSVLGGLGMRNVLKFREKT
jgi:hypothetical protein